MIQPVNGHLLIEPLVHDSFVPAAKETYEEIGTVVDVDVNSMHVGGTSTYNGPVNIGDKVYFDSWLAAKYPKAEGNDGDFYWLVKWEDVRAIEKVSE